MSVVQVTRTASLVERGDVMFALDKPVAPTSADVYALELQIYSEPSGVAAAQRPRRASGST